MKIYYDFFKEFTMVPELTYIENLHLINKFRSVDGCVVECGTWKGGMIAGIAKLLGDKEYHLFDSFEGLPKANEIDGALALQYQQDKNNPNYHDNCKADVEFAQEAMRLSGAKNFTIHKGWFSDTLPRFKKPISVLRLDGDWYGSTAECLTNLFDLVVDGGLIIIDDYYAWEGCRRALHDYLSENQKVETIMQWNNQVCFLVKNKNGLI